MIFKIDLLDALSMQADCVYLSDLHYLNDLQRTRLIRALEQTPSDAAELREWWSTSQGRAPATARRRPAAR